MRQRRGGGDVDDAIHAEFPDLKLTPAELDYLRYHWLRYQVLADAVSKASSGAASHVLDVGPGLQTELLRRRVRGLVVSTMGFAYHHYPLRGDERHIEFDLNDVHDRAHWPTPGSFDGLVLAEVIEHLYTAPRLVLEMLATQVHDGGWLIVQTPNACSLANRLRMARGVSPFEPIREDRRNPGHYHEYTLNELADVGRAAGLTVESVHCASYFLSPGRLDRACRRLAPILADSLQEGMTVTFRVAGPRSTTA